MWSKGAQICYKDKYNHLIKPLDIKWVSVELMWTVD